MYCEKELFLKQRLHAALSTLPSLFKDKRRCTHALEVSVDEKKKKRTTTKKKEMKTTKVGKWEPKRNRRGGERNNNNNNKKRPFNRQSTPSKKQ